MKTGLTAILLILILWIKTYAQDEGMIHSWYSTTGSEIIFSGGSVTVNGSKLENVVRFTAFFHLQEQYHYNFSNAVGLFTGFGVRNVGFINKVPVDAVSNATIKQRSYSFGVPLAIKLGNMTKGSYLALGGEAELMFAYKEKIFYNDEKIKNYSWFSDKVNLFNPSVFADLRFNHGSYIRFKYYLLDFLKDRDMNFILTGYPNNIYVSYKPETSRLFYIAIGTTFRNRKHVKRAGEREVQS